MTKKTWNARDTPTEALVDEIWQMKSFANNIEIELMRREYNSGT